QFFFLTPGFTQGFVEAGTGDLKTIAGVSSLTLDPGAALINASPNPPFLFGGELDFTFVGRRPRQSSGPRQSLTASQSPPAAMPAISKPVAYCRESFRSPTARAMVRYI